MKPLSIILSSLSAIAVVYAIIFEGKLKKGNKKGESGLANKSEISKVSPRGWILIGITILMCLGNGYLTVYNINDNDTKYTEDTTRYNTILKQARKQRISDSTQILGLNKTIEDNSNRSDSIKTAIITISAKEFEEQRKAKEKENENIFIHFQKEVQDNLRKTIVSYEKHHIMGFADTNLFVMTRLNNIYIKKYELISAKDTIINYLMETSEKIDRVNTYADDVAMSQDKSIRKLNIRMFLSNVEIAQNFLYAIFNKVYKLKSYKEYESINFSDSIPPPNREELNKYIYIYDESYPPSIK
jgi:hypothetical protein